MKLANTLFPIVLLSVIAGCSDDDLAGNGIDGKAVAADPTRCRIQCHLFYRDLRTEILEDQTVPSETTDLFVDFDFDKKTEKATQQIAQLPKKEPAYHATVIKRDREFILEIRNARTDTMICETSFDVQTIRKRHPAGERNLSGLTYVPHPTVEGLELQFLCTLKPAE